MAVPGDTDPGIRFDGKRALVTGAGRGIGRDTCLALARAGAHVIGVSRTQSDLDSLRQEHPSIETVAVDLSDWDATREALRDIGIIDLLVNNAGNNIMKNFLDYTREDYESVMNTNTTSAFNMSQIVAKKLVEAKRPGAIVNVSSTAAYGGIPQHTIYGMSKGALDMLTKELALDLGPHGIRTNSVNPTVTWTDLGRRHWSDPAKSQPLLSKIPLGRFVEVHEVVNAILWLLSDKASIVNGIMLTLDGGLTARLP